MNFIQQRSSLAAAISLLTAATFSLLASTSFAQMQGYNLPSVASAPQSQLSAAIQSQVAQAQAANRLAAGSMAQAQAQARGAMLPLQAAAQRQGAPGQMLRQAAAAPRSGYFAQYSPQVANQGGVQNQMPRGMQKAAQYAGGGMQNMVSGTPLVQPVQYAPAGYGVPAIGANNVPPTIQNNAGMVMGPAASPYARPTAAYVESPAVPNPSASMVPLNAGQGAPMATPGEVTAGQPMEVQPMMGTPMMGAPMMGAPMMGAPMAGGPMIDGAGCGQPMMQMEGMYQGAAAQGYYQPNPSSGDIYNSLWTEGGNDWGGGQAAASSCGCQGGCRGLCSCDPCAPSAWFRADFLFGWLSGYKTPALLSQSPTNTAVDDYSDDQTIFGGSRFGRDVRVGGRLSGGFWFDECRKVGFQAEGFSLGNDDDEINLTSNGNPFISRPFFNTNAAVNGPDSQVIALDGLAIGSFRASTTGRMVSAAPSLRWNINCCADPCSMSSTRLDLIAGYRYLQLREGFSSTEVLRPQGGNFAGGSSFTLRDDIDTQNDFHGFEIGGIYMRQSGAFTTEIQALAAFGEVDRLYTLDGSTTLFVPSAVDDTYPGGFLVRPEDIGTYQNDEFTVVPQLRVNVSYCVCKNVQLTAGYSFLYMNNVFRPGPLMTTQFDGNTLGVSPAAGVVGSALPKQDKTDVFLNSLTFGATYNF